MQGNLEDDQHGILRTENSPDASASDQTSTRISKMPKFGTKVRYLPSDNDTLWKEAEILSRAGKVTGKYKNWLNIKDKDEEAKSIDRIQCVDDWQAIEEFSNTNDLPEEDEICVTMSRHSEQEVREAKQKELENWSKFEVFEEVQDCGQPFLSVCWVCTEKTVDGRKRIKARLVPRGFEEI